MLVYGWDLHRPPELLKLIVNNVKAYLSQRVLVSNDLEISELSRLDIRIW